jgi:ubiquinone/menaquinone biosynthesis C-methylase UbiE
MPASPVTRRAPDRLAALAQYKRRAGIYDAELALFEPIRADAIAALNLRHGQTVLDVGCGTGLSFELLHQRVGASGRIVAIEQCPEMMAQARARATESRWHNVHLICEPAAAAHVRGQADAALFHFTHDILREDAALDNVLAHVKPGARVVATGLQWAPPWAVPTNAFVMAAALHSVTSFEGLGHPWSKLARRLRHVDIQHALMGGIYIASGWLADR